MDATQTIAKFEEYFKDKDLSSPLTGKVGEEVTINFLDLAKFDHELAEQLLSDPEETIRAAELAVKAKHNLDDKQVYVKIEGMLLSAEVKIRELRAKHLNKLWTFTCMVRRKTDVRPKIASIRFECSSCSNIITLLQLSDTVREPSKCGCGGRRFRQVQKELFDAYAFVGEENPEELDAGIELKKLHFMVKKRLADPIYENRIFQGIRLKITGIPKEAPKMEKSGKQKIDLDIYVDVNNIEILQSEYLNIEVTEKDREFFADIVDNPMKLGYPQNTIMGLLKNSMFSDIEGHETVKEVLILQNVGGEMKTLNTGTKARGEIHVLLVGEPGTAKSNILKIQVYFAPKARYITGGGSSGVGMTGSVVRDELMGGWSLDPGALPLCHHGLLAGDEFDKMAEEDTDKLHEALEQGTVTISKASIQATLRSETSLLAGANPKLGRFDEFTSLVKQINLPPPLITRFDFIFIFRDIPDEETDKKIAKKILSRYRQLENPDKKLDRLTIRKFFAYAKTFHPYMGVNEENIIIDFFVRLRSSKKANEGTSGTGDRMPVSARYIEVVRRAAEAHAKLHLRDRVSIIDVQAAINMVLQCLKDVAMNPETGQIEPDIIDTGYSTTQKAKVHKFSDLLDEMDKAPEYKDGIPVEDIVRNAKELGLMDSASEIERTLEKMKNIGELYQPKGPGKYKVLR